MTENLRYVDLHIIQTLPPSNINRDDAGSPKQAVFGGVRRSRVSSQAWKRATRMQLAAAQDPVDQATRTKRIAQLVAAALEPRTGLPAEDCLRIAVAAISAHIKADKKKPENTSYLLFFGRRQVEALADAIAEHATELVALTGKPLDDAAKTLDVIGVLGSGHPVDVALFGRMVADLSSLNVDAATQVAHAISTHAVDIEFDYFTAVDDENVEDAGAGMIGTVEFNAATLYRYATVAVHQLAENLGSDEDVAAAVGEFVQAFVKSIPSGHQNSFAHRTRPAMVLAVVRGDQPVSLAGAFETPVNSSSGLETASMRRLVDTLTADAQLWGDDPILTRASYRTTDDKARSAIESAVDSSVPFDSLVADVVAALEPARVE